MALRYASVPRIAAALAPGDRVRPAMRAIQPVTGGACTALNIVVPECNGTREPEAYHLTLPSMASGTPSSQFRNLTVFNGPFTSAPASRNRGHARSRLPRTRDRQFDSAHLFPRAQGPPALH